MGIESRKLTGVNFGGLTGDQHNFALFHRILRSQSSSRPGRPSQVRISGESPNVDIDQPAFVVHRKGIPTDYRIWRRCGVRSLRSYQHPIRRDETGYRCRIDFSPCVELAGLSNGCSNEPN